MKTAPIEVSYIHHCGSDLSVVNAARVSFNKESDWETSARIDGYNTLSEKDAKLIHYLAKHGHTSPFNHSFLTVRVKAPIFVARQLVKHKFMPWNEVSRRYVDEEPEFYFPDKWRGRPIDKKQGSSGEVNLTAIDCEGIPLQELSYSMFDYTKDTVYDCIKTYNKLLKAGVAPEQARMVLPQNTMTEWYWSGTLGAFCAMLNLRLKPDTQEETREVARQVASVVKSYFPISYGALVNA